jgi:hypothetical protein
MMTHDRIKKIQFFLWFYIFHSKTFRKGWDYAKANPDPDNKPFVARWYDGYWHPWRKGYDAWHTRHCPPKTYTIHVKEISHMTDTQMLKPEFSFEDHFRILFSAIEDRVKKLSNILATARHDGSPKDYSILTARGKIPIKEIRHDDTIYQMSETFEGEISDTLSPEGYISYLRGYLDFIKQDPLNPIEASPKSAQIIDGSNRRYVTSDGESAWLIAQTTTRQGQTRYILRIEEPGNIIPTGIGTIGIFSKHGTRFTAGDIVDHTGSRIVRYYNLFESDTPIE